MKKVISTLRGATAVAIVAAIGACASNATRYPNQPAVAVGSRVELNLNAEVPVEQNRVFIQNQRVVSQAQIDKGQVYCSIDMRDYRQAGGPRLAVRPGTFKVWRVRLYNDYIYEPTIYANNDSRFYAPSFGINFRTEIHLQSSSQPMVRAISCTEHRPQYDYVNRYPERAAFEATLGELVTLP